jgi:Reverse transcriptase (RNA-dependent DNA polymerase)
MENGLVGPVDEGTPQGGPLSPLLSNLVLDELDRELERRKHCFVRYADDCNIYVCSQRAGERVKRSITGFITRRLKLKVNEAKSAVARPVDRKFLGFSFTGREVKRRIAAKAIVRFKQKVRVLLLLALLAEEIAQGHRAVQAKGAGAYGADTRHQHRADDERTGQLPAWLERILRLLPDALIAGKSGSMDTS